MAQVTINKKSVNRLVEKLDLLKNPTRKQDAQDLGDLIVKEMKSEISKLNSPIRGEGRFPALQDPYKSRKGRGRIKGQRNVSTDPDLKLTGRFLRSLRAFVNRQAKGGYSTTIGFSSGLSRTKERGHREGANGQHPRPIIPTAEEGFNRRISRSILRFAEKRLRDIIRRK